MTLGDSFKDELRPLNFLGNHELKGGYLNGVHYSGIIVVPFDTTEQQDELLELFLKTYRERFAGGIDKISLELVPWSVRAYSINTFLQGKIQNRIFLIPIETIVPSMNNLVDWNSNAQQMYEEDGVYGLRGLKIPEGKNHIGYVLDYLGSPVIYGENQEPTLTKKAAYLWERIGKLQSFSNGNKRTAMVAMLVFLHSNDYDFIFTPGLKQELIDMSLKIAVELIDTKQISSYILKNVRLNLFNEKWDTLEQLRSDDNGSNSFDRGD